MRKHKDKIITVAGTVIIVAGVYYLYRKRKGKCFTPKCIILDQNQNEPIIEEEKIQSGELVKLIPEEDTITINLENIKTDNLETQTIEPQIVVDQL